MNKQEKVLAICSYLLILALIPVFWKNKSKVLKTHSDSGIILLLLWVILPFIFQIPVVGIVAGVLLLIAMLISIVWGIYDAASGRDAKIPGLEKLSAALN